VVGVGQEVVAASEYWALQSQVREPQRLLGEKKLENEILRETLALARQKMAIALALAGAGRHACGFRRCRPGIPIDVGHLLRSKSAGRSD